MGRRKKEVRYVTVLVFHIVATIFCCSQSEPQPVPGLVFADCSITLKDLERYLDEPKFDDRQEINLIETLPADWFFFLAFHAMDE